MAKNLKGSGRNILLKILEVVNTISDKIGGGGGGGGGGEMKTASSPHHPSLFVMNAYIASSTHQLVIGHLIIHNEATSMICLSD